MGRSILPSLLPLALLVSVIPGCGSGTASVSGNVTYNGEPVGKGFITFLPADGKGASAGGEIEDGHFAVDNMLPGLKVAKVEAVKNVPFARNSEDMAKRAAAQKFFGDGSGLIDPADVIPPNAAGNNEKIEIQAGKQTHDFDLKKPAGKKSR